MMKKPTTKNHSEGYSADGILPNDVLIDWYEHCQPCGSGPLGMMRMLCAVIEQLAVERNITLPPPKGLK